MRNKWNLLVISIVLVLLLSPISLSNTTNYHYNIKNDNISQQYLDHNITIGKNEKCIISNENLIFFGQNISIIDYGTFNITNTHLISPNYNIDIFIDGGELNFKNSSISSSGKIEAVNSTLNFCNTNIVNNSHIIFNLNEDKILFSHSNIKFYSNSIKNNCFTSAKLYGESYPFDRIGNLTLIENSIYPNAYTGNISINLSLYGDNNGTGELELYEFGTFIKNITIPVHKGYHNYSTNVNLPTDIKSSELNNTGILALRMPENRDSNVAGEDGNLSIYNITIVGMSNDTESYYGIDSYNMEISNSSVISFSTYFQTNMKKFYIYQRILNPFKKSIFLINSTFYSYSSIYNGDTYKDSPFYNLNSSVYFYENPKFVFYNYLNDFPIKYKIVPHNYNCSYNITASNLNKNVSTLNVNGGRYLIFDTQINQSISYYGDYELIAGEFVYKFSLMPIPSFTSEEIIKIHVNIPAIAVSIQQPETLYSGHDNKLYLTLKSEMGSSTILVKVKFSGNIIYNSTVEIQNNKTISIPLIINSTHGGKLNYTIKYDDEYYNFSSTINNSMQLQLTKIKNNIEKYILTIKSPVSDWHLGVDGKNILEKKQIANLSLASGTYEITIYKNGYNTKTFRLNLTNNTTLYVSLGKISNKSNFLETLYILIIPIIIATILGIVMYSKRTVTCPVCGTRHYSSFDKCPVCLTPVKHRMIRKNRNR